LCSRNGDVLSSPITDFSSSSPTTPVSNSRFVRANKVFDISSIARFNFEVNLERAVGICTRNGKTFAKRLRPMFNVEAEEDELKVSKIWVTEACFPSRAPKSCEKPARPMVSRLPRCVRRQLEKKKKGKLTRHNSSLTNDS
jgi:hypothetical protein